jgi:hypothetical protein
MMTRVMSILAVLSIGLLLVGTAIGIGDFLWPSKYLLDDATFIVAVAGGTIALSQFQLLRLQLDEENTRRHRERSFSFTLGHQPHLREARSHLEKFFKEEMERSLPCNPDRLNRVLQGKELTQEGERCDPMMLKHLLAHWEHLAMTIYCKATDEDIAFEAVGSVVIGHVAVFKHYIAQSNVINPRTYVYLIHLAKRWDDRLQRPGRPFFIAPTEHLTDENRRVFLSDLSSPFEQPNHGAKPKEK